MSEYEEKTEKATPRRRQKAKEEGNVARSPEIMSMTTMAGIILVFYFAGNVLIRDLSLFTGNLLGLRYGRDPFTAMRSSATEIFRVIGPFLGITFTFAMVSGLLQSGFVMKPLTFKTEFLNPMSGLKSIFSRNGFVQLLKNLFKFTLGGILFYFIIKKTLTVLPFTSAMDISQIQSVSAKLIFKAVMYMFTTFLVLAVIDYLIVRWRFESSIKMTRDEIKEEYKETEGNPLMKARIRSIQKEMARRRMMQEVPRATVVITNPTHIAVALRYKKDEMSAPKVIAKGAGFIAEKIMEIARKYNIPIVEDKPLARALYKLKIDSLIPVELYRAVAKILSYIYKLRGVA
jgi:flagellar biosynthetic protein FlhB